MADIVLRCQSLSLQPTDIVLASEILAARIWKLKKNLENWRGTDGILNKAHSPETEI